MPDLHRKPALPFAPLELGQLSRKSGKSNRESREFGAESGESPPHVRIAARFVGTREVGKNRGRWVEAFLAHVGLDPGYPWCAAFVSYVLDRAGAKTPTVRDARSRLFREVATVTAEDVKRGERLAPGTLTVHRYSRWTGHIGILEHHDGAGAFSILDTIEGNTSNPQGEGEGVFRKRRRLVGSNYNAPTSFVEVGYD